MVKLRLRMIMYLAQDHVAWKWSYDTSNPSQPVYTYPLSLAYPFLVYLYSFSTSYFERGVMLGGNRKEEKRFLERTQLKRVQRQSNISVS